MMIKKGGLKLKNKYFVAILCFMFLLAVGCTQPSKKPIVPKKVTPLTSKTKKMTEKLKVTTFSMEDKGKFDPNPSLRKHAKHIDRISPLWYSVQPDGRIKDVTNKEMLAFARKNKIKVVPLVNCVKSKGEVLTDKDVRDKTITELMRIVDKYKLDGYNIDFEFIPDGSQNYVKDKDLLTDFMKRLKARMQPKGKEVDMSVIPHYQVSQDVGGIYDYSKLAPIVDHVTLMLYDRHEESSKAGPVAPEKWVEENVKNALSEGFKPSQICMGVATYGYDWPASQTGGFSSATKEILETAAKYGAKVKWDEKHHEPYYIYTDKDSGQEREVWFESSHTLKEKIAMAKKYKVMGICIWRMGFETESFWKVIESDI